MERVKTRKPIVAFLLSLLLPGLGHVYWGCVRLMDTENLCLTGSAR
jgi:hypothetical protein